MLVAFRDGYLGQPPEQLIGVKGTISTYLEYFLSSEITEVFCANEPTFSVHQIDDGKIVSVAMPQKFQSERPYINTILKLSYYFHALSRSRLAFTTLEPTVISELQKFFRPELIGRFDEKIVFKPLSPDTQREIARLAMSEELARFREGGLDLTVSDEAFESGAGSARRLARGP